MCKIKIIEQTRYNDFLISKEIIFLFGEMLLNHTRCFINHELNRDNLFHAWIISYLYSEIIIKK